MDIPFQNKNEVQNFIFNKAKDMTNSKHGQYFHCSFVCILGLGNARILQCFSKAPHLEEKSLETGAYFNVDTQRCGAN